MSKEEPKIEEQIELQKFLFEVEDFVKNPSKYHKDKTPDFTKPFTEKEKDDFENQYKSAVEILNKNLPDNMKLNLDVEGLRKKMNDPKEIEIYRRSKYVQEQINKQHELLEKYRDENKNNLNSIRVPFKEYISCLIRTDDSEESKSFNEKLFRFYSKYSAGFMRSVLKGLCKADSSYYEAILKDDYERSKVYTDNFEHGLLAKNIDDILKKLDEGVLINEIKDSTIKPLIELKSGLGEGFTSPDDMFTLPKMTSKQIENCRFSTPDSIKYLNRIEFDSSEHFEEQKNDIRLLKERSFLDEKEPVLTYKAVETTLGEEKEFKDLAEGLKNNVRIVKRSEKEKSRLLEITKGARKYDVYVFGKLFVNYYNERSGKNLTSFNPEKILDNHKGGFFERLFKTTSKEYLDFVKCFKNFSDENSPDLADKDLLYASAKAYIEHKNVKNDADIEKLDSTGRERVKFCMSVIDALGMSDKDNKNAINEEVKKDIVEEKIEEEPIKSPVKGLENDVKIEGVSNSKKATSTNEKYIEVEKNISK